MTNPAARERAIEAGLQYHRAGQLTEAEKIYRQVLETDPSNADAMHLLGLIAYQRGSHAAAEELIRGALARRPSEPTYLNNLGQALQGQGRFREARACYEKALAAAPAYPEAYCNLGNVLCQLEAHEEALRCYRFALDQRPDFALAWGNLGRTLKRLGRPHEAAASLSRAAALDPGNAETHNSLGTVFQDQGKLDEAVSCYSRATELRPQFAEALNNLGNVLRVQKKIGEAIACYERALAANPKLAAVEINLGMALGEAGRTESAVACFRRAIELQPESHLAHHHLGIALKALGRGSEAAQSFRRVIALQPDNAEGYNNLGAALYDTGRFGEALSCFERALELRPDFVEALNNRGNALQGQGRLAQAVASYRSALRLRPDLARVHSNLLLTLTYDGEHSVEETFAEHVAFSERFERPLRARWPDHRGSRAPRDRLTVAYLSPDLRRHAVTSFFRTVLSAHDRSRFRLIAYSASRIEDEVSEELKARVDLWRRLHGASDDEAAQQIAADEADILVDLAGHTAENRILVFCRKPAPVQVTWLGYPNTTGLAAMDYRLTDRNAEIPAHAKFYTEELVYLPDSVWCYSGHDDSAEVKGLPALQRGYVTFGSLNSFAKVGPGVLDLWARLLAAVPGSRLLIARAPKGAESEALARMGVSSERVEFAEPVAVRRFLELYHRVDIALDPFPYNGGATTCDALWMGVPVIALAGDRFASRAGVSLLTAAGLADWIAQNEDQYVELGQRWARDLQGLAGLRTNLRGRLRESALMNATSFTHNLENAYRMMWEKYQTTG
jgi:predicted O-linked N-acetylglucosamine transferase (SPINDLY family)